MKLIYETRKRSRIKSRFININIYKIDGSIDGYWFSNKDGKYKPIIECSTDGEGYGNVARERINSIKAFVNWCKKHWNEIPNESEIMLVSKYVGHNVSIFKKGS